MNFEGNMFCLNNVIREENGNSNANSFAWDSWEPTTSTNSRHINIFHTTTTTTTTAAESSAATTGLANALMYDGVHQHRHRQQKQQQPRYGGDGSHVHLDPHLTCLKLGKRHYFEDANNAVPLGERHVVGVGDGGGCGFTLEGKRAKAYYGSGVKTASFTTAPVPRCQVEGCHVALLNAKEYHRRHKVCEMHSKAPIVVVLGMEQRFCQQCSRFHVVSEFDDSKRSCRRRLAGHNERRRKSSHDSVARNSSEGNKWIGGCTLSLLSSRSDSWLSHADLSIRCSAALRELIAENRASLMARQLVLDRDWHLHHHAVEDFKEMEPESNYFPQQMFPQTQ